MPIPRSVTLPLLAATVLGLAMPAVAAVDTYISLGDSLAFGYTTFEQFGPTFADQGFVRGYADGVAAGQGGLRPQVINLGVVSETTASFFSGGLPTVPANLNYSLAYSPPYPSQSTLFDIQAGLHPAQVVSIELGSNDLFALAADPAFQASPQQDVLLAQALNATAGRYQAILQDVQARLPLAEVLVVGTYNPFAIVPTSPFSPLAGVAVPLLNSTLKSLADATGARYVDVFSAFAGHEADYTSIQTLDTATGQPNVHPTPLGYSVIANLMLAQSAGVVPEPSSIVLVGLGLAGLAATRLKRRAVSA